MSTNLTGFSRETVKGNGGVYKLYLTELSNISGVSVTNGLATISVAADMWSEFVLGKESGSIFTSTGTIDSTGSVTYIQLMTAMFTNNTVAKREELRIMGRSELVCVICDTYLASDSAENGNIYIIGLETGNMRGGCDITAPVLTSGAQTSEANLMTIPIQVSETCPPLSISQADFELIQANSAVN